MTHEIYCYGGIDIYRDVFNAIAMLNGNKIFIHSLITIGVIVGGFWASVTMIFGDMIKPFMGWIIPMTIIQTVFLTPTSTVHLIDVVQGGRHEVVDHVPYGLALIAGSLSRISHQITQKTEAIFTLPSDLKYSQTGGIFAANLLANQKMMVIQDEDFAENMRSFIGQCVLYDLALGRKYTLKDLRNTDNIWGLIASHASPARAFVWKDNHNRGEIITCQSGVVKFNQAWTGAIDHTACAAGSQLYPPKDSQRMSLGGGGKPVQTHCRSPLAQQEFLRFLPSHYGVMAGMSASATDILKQQMMISALVDGQDHASMLAGNASNFAARKAYLQQRSSYETIGKLASDTLPIMRAVLELICYALFLFIMPILVLPMGYRVLTSWAQTILWLAMWPPMYAILHLIMVSAIAMKTKSYMGISNSEGITLASSLGVQNISADMAAMAGYLSMSIPFICIAVVKGVSSFVHMSSSLGAVSQGAATGASNEAFTGNYQLGNTSMDNHSMGNVSMLSENYNGHLGTGSTRLQEGHTSLTYSSDGSMVASIEQSNLPVSINMAQSIANNKRTAAHHEMSMGQSQMESAERNISSSMEHVGNLGEILSNSTNIQEGWTENKQREIGKSMQMVNQAVDELSKDAGITKEKAANVMASISAPDVAKFFTGFSGGTSINSSNTSRETISKAQKISEQTQFDENVRTAIQASQHLSKNSSDDQVRSYANNHQASLNQAARDSESAQKHIEKSQRLSREADHVESQSGTINRNMNQQFMEWLSKQPGDHSSGIEMGYNQAVGLMTHKPEVASIFASNFMNDNMPKMNLGTDERSLNSNYHNTQISSSVDQGVVTQLASKSENEISDRVSSKSIGLENRVSDNIEGANQFIKNAQEDVVYPARATLQKEHDRQSTDVGVVAAVKYGLSAVNNVMDSPYNFVSETVEDVIDVYQKHVNGQSKQPKVFKDLPTMVSTSIESDGYLSNMKGHNEKKISLSHETEKMPKIIKIKESDMKTDDQNLDTLTPSRESMLKKR